MKDRVVLDVAALPLHGRGSKSPTWWATLAFMLIEGSGFGLAIAVYFYLMKSGAPHGQSRLPARRWAGTWLTAVLVASAIPNILVSRWARQKDLRKVRLGLVVMTVCGVIPMAFRAFEFAALRINWDAMPARFNCHDPSRAPHHAYPDRPGGNASF